MRAELESGLPHAGHPREQGLRADPLSAMTPRFNLFFRWFARRYFRDFDLETRPWSGCASSSSAARSCT
jgi:hypothetical protein